MKRLLLLMGCVSTLAAQSWYNSAWVYRKAVVLDHRYVLAAQIGYVATIFVPNTYQVSAVGDADVAGNIRSDCRDVVFTGSDGKTPVEYQIVPGTCDSTSGRFVAKVRIASLSASDDAVLMMYFGNASAADQANTAPWDANYKGVWYGDSLKDATGNQNDLVVSAGALATTANKIGTAFQFIDPTTQLTTSGTIPGSASFSLSAWIRGERSPQRQMSSGFSQPVTVGTNAYEFTWDTVNGAGADARFGNLSPAVPSPARTLLGKQPYLFAITCASGTFSVYLDGAPRSSGTVANCNTGNQILRIGGGTGTFFEGRVEEVEYSITARSKEFWYIKWLNEAHPEYFVTFGARQAEAPAAPSIDVFTASYTGVEAGQSVVLRWIVSGSPASVSIDQGLGAQSNPIAGSVPARIDATTTYTLTASNSSGSTTKTVTVRVLTAPLTYARSGPPAGTYIIGYSSSSGTTAQMTVGEPLPVLPGDYIIQRGLATSDAAGGYFSNLNGVFKVKQVLDSSHYTIVDKAGNDVTPNGTYYKGAWNPFNDAAIKFTPNGAAWAGKATPYRFVEGPRGTLDGTNGTRTRTMALGTHNGLVSLVVSGNVATVTTSFDPSLLHIASGVNVAVWGTTRSALNNGNTNSADYTITSVSANSYQFAVSGVPDGNYTHNDVCGPSPNNPNIIGGTENCVRISLFAIKSNVEFQQIRAQVPTGNSYKYVFDGGTVAAGAPSGGIAWAAEMFMVDQANQAYLDEITYLLTHLERISGVNFVVDEWSGNNPAGNVMADINSTHEMGADIAEVYQAGSRYLTSAQKLDATGKILNHRATSNADCKKAVPQPIIVATGTAQGGSSNTIILAPNETKDFTNNYVYRNNGTDIYFALISNYNPATKTATVSTIYNYGIIHVSSRPVLNPATWTAPVAGEGYTIYATVTLSGTTVTGYNTRFTSYSTGDGVFAMIGDINTIYQVLPAGLPDIIDYVSAIGSDTSLTIIKGVRNETMSGTPKMLMYVPKWKPGDCGLTELMHYGWGFGSQPIQRPPNGGYLTVGSDGQTPSLGSNNKPIQARAYMALAAAMADDDPVQAADIYGLGQNWWFDYELPFQWMFWTPVLNEGPNYSFGNSMMKGWYPLWLHKVMEGFPMPAVSSTYWTNYGLLKMFYPKPDKASGVLWNTSWGGDGSDNALSQVSGGSAHLMIADQGFVWQPFSTSSAYLRNWTEANLSNGYWGNVGSTRWMYYDLDPRIPSSDYTVLPRQYFFTNIEETACSLTTGWDCGYLGHADTVISRTSWTDREASLVTLHGRPYTGAYDCPQMGDLWLYKAGWLLGNDYAGSAGQCGPYSTSTGLTTWESGFEFNGANTVTVTNGLGQTLAGSAIRRWRSDNHGTWSEFYGDQSSKVAYAVVDFADAYKPTYNRVWRHMVHFKGSGAEVVVQFDDVDTSNQPATAGIRSQVHFPQNGEAAKTSGGLLVEYEEGSTSCVNCEGTNPAGYVWERENGAAADSKGPARSNGLVASFFSPDSITVRWDGHSYSGARGHTERLSICAGTSCGAAATTLEVVHVYEVQTSVDSTTPTATALNPDVNWTGARTADKTALFSRGGKLRSAVPSFSAPAGQVLIAGLAAGRYDVTAGGTTVVSGATVSDGDNTLYFDSPGGTVSVARTDISVCSIPTATLPTGSAGAIYSAGLETANCAAPVVWDVSAGSLCGGLSLDPASGRISGIPAVAGSCNFTVRATDSGTNSAERALSITVAPPAAAFSRGVTIAH